jgi:CBS domain containing-hemolysin-like protein
VTLRLLLDEINKNNQNKKLSEIKLIKPLKVPLNKPIDELLKKFQKARQHLAIVIDEYGGVAGLVTLEDIIEEVFGEIQDETDKEEVSIKQISDTEYEVDSTVLIEDILEKF